MKQFVLFQIYNALMYFQIQHNIKWMINNAF